MDRVSTEKEQDTSAQGSPEEESHNARIARLGRERPPTFRSLYSEIAFVFSVCMSQILTEFFVSGFTVLLPTLIRDLHIPQASSVWPATAFSLVIASTLIVFGRLGDMWGGYPVYLGGLGWICAWSLIAGFSINPLMLDFCRAFQGLGAAAYLPAGVQLMGSAYRPGPRKNLVFSIYGSCAVIGFFCGIFIAGLVGQYLAWGWYFWMGSIVAALTLLTSAFSISNDWKEHRGNGITMDWPGAATIVSGLVLVVFAITESAHAPNGWRTPYIPILLCLGIILLFLAVYIEGWVAKVPLLPLDLFRVKHLTPLVLALLMLYGVAGIFLLYGTQYFQNIMGASPFQITAWYVPTVIAGLIVSTSEGFILHLVPGQVLLLVSGVAAIGAELLLAFIPEGANYWAWVLPAAILVTVGIDLSINLITVFVTTQLPKARQGLAGGLINSVLQLGIALALGFADILQTYTEASSGLRQSYKNTFWFGLGIALSATALIAIWGGVPMATSDLTADEKAELVREATRESQLERNINQQSHHEQRETGCPTVPQPAHEVLDVIERLPR